MTACSCQLIPEGVQCSWYVWGGAAARAIQLHQHAQLLSYVCSTADNVSGRIQVLPLESGRYSLYADAGLLRDRELLHLS